MAGAAEEKCKPQMKNEEGLRKENSSTRLMRMTTFAPFCGRVCRHNKETWNQTSTHGLGRGANANCGVITQAPRHHPQRRQIIGGGGGGYDRSPEGHDPKHCCRHDRIQTSLPPFEPLVRRPGIQVSASLLLPKYHLACLMSGATRKRTYPPFVIYHSQSILSYPII